MVKYLWSYLWLASFTSGPWLPSGNGRRENRREMWNGSTETKEQRQDISFPCNPQSEWVCGHRAYEIILSQHIYCNWVYYSVYSFPSFFCHKAIMTIAKVFMISRRWWWRRWKLENLFFFSLFCYSCYSAASLPSDLVKQKNYLGRNTWKEVRCKVVETMITFVKK